MVRSVFCGLSHITGSRVYELSPLLPLQLREKEREQWERGWARQELCSIVTWSLVCVTILCCTAPVWASPSLSFSFCSLPISKRERERGGEPETMYIHRSQWQTLWNPKKTNQLLSKPCYSTKKQKKQRFKGNGAISFPILNSLWKFGFFCFFVL